MSDAVRLHELDKSEWWDVCRLVRPDITEEDFEVMWDQCFSEKARRKLH